MKPTITKFGALSCLALLALGCANTSEGIAKDADVNSKMAAKSGSDAVEGATLSNRDATAAISLTPAVKLAIAADSSLNDPANRIDVDSSDTEVKISGTVKSQADKEGAEKIATKILSDHRAHQKLVNQLTVVEPAKGAMK